ncbi:hypothetical protein F4808DRAFT_458144 [Astrocystis sublimbata]|nr:hypothetical protein F4808DRAFT_458144 [Astrocystis sublimbata]
MAPAPDKKADDLLKRPLYFYNLPYEVLESLTLRTESDSDSYTSHDFNTNSEAPSPAPSQDSSQTPTENPVGSQACSLCRLSFATVEDQRGHQKSDWHHYNLKQKLRGAAPVSEVEFEKLVDTLDESLSGSQSSESEDDEADRGGKDSTLTALLKKQAVLADKNARASNGHADADAVDDEVANTRQRGSGNPPLLWFSSPLLPTNHYFGVWRTIFQPDELKNEANMLAVIKQKQLQPITIPNPKADGTLAPEAYKGPHFFLCMIGGGHFAAMVVSLAPRHTKHGSVGPMNKEAIVLAHKTFHRYTTRRKQGGSQSANDNAKGAAHSAGSSIRRYNEQALTDEVRLLLQDWKGLIDTSELLFIRATGATSRRTLFGPYDDQILRANDARIRSIPFNTQRPTQNELMRSFIKLTRLQVVEIDPTKRPTPKTTTEKPAASDSTKPTKPSAPKLSEEEETALLHTSQLQAFIRRSKLPALLAYLSNNGISPNYTFQPSDTQQNHHAPTPLHLAASHNSAALVSGLLLKGNADPALQSAEGKTAFDLAGDRATRDAFRVARHEIGEDKWDWEGANVPAAMKRDDALRREEREREEERRKEGERRRGEEERLRSEGGGPDMGKGRGKGKSVLDAGVPRSAQDKREQEARGLTPEQKMRVDRERRARAAEERFRRLQG